MTEEEAREVVKKIADELQPGWNAFLRGDYLEGQWRFQRRAEQVDVTIPRHLIDDNELHQIKALIGAAFAMAAGRPR